MKVSVGIIDYGMGNLHSVAKALALSGARVTVSNSARRLKQSQLLVLPGVGAFGAAMKTLAKKRLDDLVVEWIANDKPYLGICLGFQLLFERSQESKRIKGLGIFKGSVVRFKRKDLKKGFDQIPHMGWNTVERSKSNKTLFKGINKKERFYFVHTFYPEPTDKEIVFTQTKYGKKFCSSISRGNLFASQFHPEKSGNVGLHLLKNIVTEASVCS